MRCTYRYCQAEATRVMDARVQGSPWMHDLFDIPVCDAHAPERWARSWGTSLTARDASYDLGRGIGDNSPSPMEAAPPGAER